jgi:hypothetical protein
MGSALPSLCERLKARLRFQRCLIQLLTATKASWMINAEHSGTSIHLTTQSLTIREAISRPFQKVADPPGC